jgi:predicted MFS family arabinose efflux permease
MTRDLRLVALSLLIWGLGEGMFIYFQPIYLQQLGADPVQIGGILGLAAAGMLLSHLPAGVLADHLGRKTIMVSSWMIALAASGMMALARGLSLFVAGMVVYSFSVFVMSPMSSYITQAGNEWSPARALTTVSAGFSAGMILGPVIGGQLAEALGLRSVYALAAGVFVLSTSLILLIRPQPVDPAHDGHRYRELLTNRRFGGFLVLIFMLNFGMYLAWPLTPNFLQSVRQVSLGQIGLLGAFTGLGTVVFNLALGHLPPKRGMLIAQALVGGAVLALWLGVGFPWYAAGYFLFAGYRTARSLITATIHGLVRPAEIGLAFGANETVAAAGLMAAGPVAGVLFHRQPSLPFPVGAGLIVLGLVLSAGLAPNTQAGLEPEPPGERGVVGGV